MKFCVITCTVRTVVLVVNLRQVIQNLKMRFPAETRPTCKIQTCMMNKTVLSCMLYSAYEYMVDSCRDVAVRVGVVRVGGGV